MGEKCFDVAKLLRLLRQEYKKNSVVWVKDGNQFNHGYSHFAKILIAFIERGDFDTKEHSHLSCRGGK